MNDDHKPIIEKLWRTLQATPSHGPENTNAYDESPGRFYRSQLPQIAANGEGRIPAIDAWVGRFPINFALSPDGQSPSLTPAHNLIKMPPLRDFKSTKDFYSSLFHEMIHWAGVKLNRPSFANPDCGISRIYEEIIADTGASILNSYWGIDTVVKNASYVRFYIDQLPRHLHDQTFAICALGASKSVDYLMKAA